MINKGDQPVALACWRVEYIPYAEKIRMGLRDQVPAFLKMSLAGM